MDFQLAQVNIGRLAAPLDDPRLAGFVEALDPINAIADCAPVYGQMHREILRRRREFFEPMQEAYTACWWVPAGHRPSTDEAEERIRKLRSNGVTPYAFTLRQHFPPPDAAAA